MSLKPMNYSSFFKFTDTFLRYIHGCYTSLFINHVKCLACSNIDCLESTLPTCIIY